MQASHTKNIVQPLLLEEIQLCFNCTEICESHRSKLKLIAFLDACTRVLSYFPLKKGSYFGFLTIFVSLVLPDAPIILHERWWVRCYACNQFPRTIRDDCLSPVVFLGTIANLVNLSVTSQTLQIVHLILQKTNLASLLEGQIRQYTCASIKKRDQL